jgi:hypothetical protein
MTGERVWRRDRVRLAAVMLAILAVLADKTPTACKGPPGDTGGGDWRISGR